MPEKKRPRRTPQRILETSLALFNRFGEPHITTADIADEMNISPGNLYYHFRNKDDIIGALYDALEADLAPLLSLPEGRAAGVEDLWLLLHLLFERMREYRFFYRDLDEITSRNRKIAMRFARDRRRRVQRDARRHLLDVVPADRRTPWRRHRRRRCRRRQSRSRCVPGAGADCAVPRRRRAGAHRAAGPGLPVMAIGRRSR